MQISAQSRRKDGRGSRWIHHRRYITGRVRTPETPVATLKRRPALFSIRTPWQPSPRTAKSRLDSRARALRRTYNLGNSTLIRSHQCTVSEVTVEKITTSEIGGPGGAANSL